MKCILFCENPYSFSILNPIKEELIKCGWDCLWYFPEKHTKEFKYKETDKFTNSIKDLVEFSPDLNLVPGNDFPHYISGLKVQIFHGFAGEKKGHFRIRHYFDLYLTQGPWFTDGFKMLQEKYKNFEVVETGWPKLDPYLPVKEKSIALKERLLGDLTAKKIILYAPTFSPSLTSIEVLKEQIKLLSMNSDYLILIKFHDLTKKEWIGLYKDLAKEVKNIKIIHTDNILEYLVVADLLISDTSSVVYESLLLNKPTVTFKSISKNIYWENFSEASQLSQVVERNLLKDPYSKDREQAVNQMHPYTDGLSSRRVVDAIDTYIKQKGIPNERRLSFFRKRKIHKRFGKY